jgi:hypothetical protein
VESSGETTSTSRIDHVTIYSHGARVRRVTRAGIAAGEIRITGLPLSVVDDTVRAELIGGGAVVGVRVELDAVAASARDDHDVDKAVRAARDRVAAGESDVARLNAALGQLGALAPAARRPRPDGAVPSWSQTFDARIAVLDLRIGRERALRDALDAAQRALRDAREALAAAQDRAARASTGRGLRAHELCKVVVASIADAPATAELAVEYAITAARWAPTYCVRMSGGQAQLELRAVVAQCSGEDWRGVRLTVSTAEPMRFSELPELPMARIGRRQPVAPRRGFRPPPTGADVLYQDFDRAFPGRSSPQDAKPFTDRHTRQEMTVDSAPSYDRYAATVPATTIAAPAPPPPPAEFDEAESASIHYGGDFELDDDTAVNRSPDMRRRGSTRPKPGFAAMAMPAPAAPAGMAQPMRSKGRLVGVGAKTAPPVLADEGGARGYVAAEEEQTAVMDVLGDDPSALLAYAGVRMAPASDPRRGRLVRVTAVAAYAEALVLRGLSIADDADLIGEIAARDQRVESLPLPPGTEADWDHVYDHAFDADAAVDVESDGTWHAVALTARSGAVAHRHVVVPREGTEVYRIAEMTNPLGGPLLPGPIDVFDDGVYLLTSHVDGVPAGAPLELGLGVDPKIKASRNIDYREEASGMLRGSLRLDHTVTIEVSNQSARAADVEVRERIPIVLDGNDDVELDVTRTEPRWEKWTPPPSGPGSSRLRGGHRWRLTIPAGDKRTLVASYSIRIASKHELVGGNRRES